MGAAYIARICAAGYRDFKLLCYDLMAACQDDVFLSDAEDLDGGLLMMEDFDQFTPVERGAIDNGSNAIDCEKRRGEWTSTSEQVALCVEEMEEETRSDTDSVAVIVVDDQPRRGPSADRDSPNTAHFQPSQIEEKLHSLLSADGGTQQADINNNAGATAVNIASSRGLRRASIWNGMVACLSPVVGYFRKEKQPTLKQDEWEIDFADISELDFIGSGAQGAVFAGEYLGKKVAVKKVKDPKYCDEAYNLRKLDHPNIVKMM